MQLQKQATGLRGSDVPRLFHVIATIAAGSRPVALPRGIKPLDPDAPLLYHVSEFDCSSR